MEDKLPSPSKSNKPQTSRNVKKGGWADETARATTALEKRFSSLKLKKQTSSEEGGGILELSDDYLEVEQEEDLPNNSGMNLNSEGMQNRAATYKELTSTSKNNISNFLEGVDLRLLTRNLLPESQLKEVDASWNWDVLFAELMPELHH